MKTFSDWWAMCFFEPDRWAVAEAAWEAATLAERERLEKIVLSERNFIEENYCELPGEVGQYYGGRLDAYDNVLYAIRNP